MEQFKRGPISVLQILNFEEVVWVLFVFCQGNFFFKQFFAKVIITFHEFQPFSHKDLFFMMEHRNLISFTPFWRNIRVLRVRVCNLALWYVVLSAISMMFVKFCWHCVYWWAWLSDSVSFVICV